MKRNIKEMILNYKDQYEMTDNEKIYQSDIQQIYEFTKENPETTDKIFDLIGNALIAGYMIGRQDQQ